VDLVLSLHKNTGLKATVLQVSLIFAGIAIIALFRFH